MSQAVADRAGQAPTNVEPHPGATDMLAMIERMAVNPNIDTDKLERLIAMKKDMDATSARLAFNAAMVAMQPELPIIAKNGRTDKAKYALWEDIQDEIVPVLKAHGFALSFKTASAAEQITVTAILRHEAGHEDTTELTLPSDKGPGRNNVQAIGSAVSYGKRYTASALLNLRIGGEDDDGKQAGLGETLNDDQIDAVEEAMSAAIAEKGSKDNVYRSNFLKFMQVETVSAIKARDFKKAMDAIRSTRAGK